MSSQKEIYFERKNRVLECLGEAEKFLSENGFENEKQSVMAQHSNVENGDFTIAVVGEFSAGKSTFLNALMGEKLLPSFSRETTATINFLRHKDKAENGAEGCVYYNDGTEKKLDKADRDTIEKYVCTRSTEDVATNISHFDLFLDNKFLKDNVTLVDTPGLNGIKEGHEEITKKQIEKSSASIFLFNANQPGSKTDFEALQMLRKRVNSIFLVLNRIDEIKSDEGETPEDIINILKEKYKQDYPDEKRIPEFFPISAYKALLARSTQKLSYHDRNDFTNAEKEKFEADSGMKVFEEKLWKFLTEGEKGRQMLISPVVQLESILADVMNFLHEQKEVLEGTCDSEELEQRIIDLKNASVELQKEIEARANNIYSGIKDAEKEFTEEIESEVVQFKENYMRKIENFDSFDDIDPDYITKNVKDKFKYILSDAYMNYGRRIEEILASDNASVSEELRDLLQNSQKELSVDGITDLTKYETGLEDFDQRLSSMKVEIDSLIDELEKNQGDFTKHKKLERERKELEKKIEITKEGKKWYEQNALAALPNIKASTKEVLKRQERGGVMGKFADWLVGEKAYVTTETFYDSRERDEYKKEMAERKKEYDNEIAAYQAEKEQYVNADSEAVAQKMAATEKKIERKRAEMAEFQEEYMKKMKEKYAKQLKKQKLEISRYIEDRVYDFKKCARDQFNSSRNAQIESMKILVAAPLYEQLKISQDQAEILKKKLDSSESERNEHLRKVDSQIEALKPILNRTMDLRSELESIEVNTIKEVEL